MQGADAMGFLATTAVGIVGSVIGAHRPDRSTRGEAAHVRCGIAPRGS